MITPSQIRAARNFIGIDQKILADAVGVSKMNISDIENEKSKPRANTLHSIELYFRTCGIRLTAAGGIEPDHNLVTVYEGADCYSKFLASAQALLAEKKGEVLFSGSDERRTPPEILQNFNDMRASGIRMRSLIEHGNSYIMGPLDEYRWMPEELFVEGDVKAIFSDRVGYLVSWSNIRKVIVIQDATIATEARRSFEYIWKRSETPTNSTADIFYENCDG